MTSGIPWWIWLNLIDEGSAVLRMDLTVSSCVSNSSMSRISPSVQESINRAAQTFREALKTDPLNVLAHFNLAVSLRQLVATDT